MEKPEKEAMGQTVANDACRIVLASASPRRRLLLEGAGLTVDIQPADIDESTQAGEDPVQYALRMARSKARVCHGRIGGRPPTVVAGDTVVTLDGEILPKPTSTDHAAAMLRTLSGRQHVVISAWATVDAQGELHSGHDTAEITFRRLSSDEIEQYVDSGEPLDKAGAYGIQGLGGQLVAAFQGDFDTIVGLNVASILQDLRARRQIAMSALGIRLATIRARIAVAADVAQRPVSTVRIVGAAKAQTNTTLADAYAYGLRHFGDSYEQELRMRDSAWGPRAQWHFIGRLQRNKAKRVVQQVEWIHTVDSRRLADAIGRHASDLNKDVRCLIQVNIANEPSKGGVMPDDCAALVAHVNDVPGLTVCGLMALPPRTGFAELRQWFRRVRNLRDEIQTPECPLPELSMGMSQDLDAAIVEGATFIRPGSALFGPRPTA
ncbi:MAG: YggS family pyridoxal phosphate-dependent enzyme [Myxococcota bacterium]|nr:YggS family pyridoxal phosphate-dependent enzyme [Myxococcota bacterium]